MGWIRKLFTLIVLLVGVVLGVWFSADNTQPVDLVLLGFPLSTVASGVLIPSVLLLGAILGYVFSLLSGLKGLAELRSLRRGVERRDREIERLRKQAQKS